MTFILSSLNLVCFPYLILGSFHHFFFFMENSIIAGLEALFKNLNFPCLSNLILSGWVQYIIIVYVCVYIFRYRCRYRYFASILVMLPMTLNLWVFYVLTKVRLDSWFHDLCLTSLLVYSDAGWFLEITEGFAGRVTCCLSTYYISQLFRWSGPWTLAPCWVTILISILYLLIFLLTETKPRA